MSQRERNWLLALRKADEGLITQKQAAAEMKRSERHVQRLLAKLRREGDKAVIHGIRGQPSNHKIAAKVQQEAIEILSQDVYRGFGPTLAAEYLADRHQINVSRETLRNWMIEAGLWRPRSRKLEAIHCWRPRRSRRGELVQWDTSDHDWLEGRGEKIYLIDMIDDATSELLARFVSHDTTAENMRVLWEYLERNGRPLSFYTDRGSVFANNPKKRDGEDLHTLPPTQIGRALRELGIVWTPAYSPQARGRVERSFGTAQDRLVKGLRVAGVSRLEEANQYLDTEYLPWWSATLTVKPAHPDDAHRALEPEQQLGAILSHVERRRVSNDYTIRFEGTLYQIARRDVRTGLRGAKVRVEKRLDGTLAVRYREHYLQISQCHPQPKASPPARPAAGTGKRSPARRGSDWMANFDLKKSMPVWKAARASGARAAGSDR